MPTRPRSHDVPPDSPEYIEAWARDLVAAIGKRKARLILAADERHPEVKKTAGVVSTRRTSGNLPIVHVNFIS
ncbi:MAG: hypothetical protein QGG09_11065 [Pirellulaceae bacterium]|nr:hypothetical protein [Pirellulaceae bacterium]HJN11633.1 hypothetical protein [Pirellulaceae bacterium]